MEGSLAPVAGSGKSGARTQSEPRTPIFAVPLIETPPGTLCGGPSTPHAARTRSADTSNRNFTG